MRAAARGPGQGPLSAGAGLPGVSAPITEVARQAGGEDGGELDSDEVWPLGMGL